MVWGPCNLKGGHFGTLVHLGAKTPCLARHPPLVPWPPDPVGVCPTSRWSRGYGHDVMAPRRSTPRPHTLKPKWSELWGAISRSPVGRTGSFKSGFGLNTPRAIQLAAQIRNPTFPERDTGLPSWGTLGPMGARGGVCAQPCLGWPPRPGEVGGHGGGSLARLGGKGERFGARWAMPPLPPPQGGALGHGWKPRGGGATCSPLPHRPPRDRFCSVRRLGGKGRPLAPRLAMMSMSKPLGVAPLAPWQGIPPKGWVCHILPSPPSTQCTPNPKPRPIPREKPKQYPREMGTNWGFGHGGVGGHGASRDGWAPWCAHLQGHHWRWECHHKGSEFRPMGQTLPFT
jgi:hypothetical protein